MKTTSKQNGDNLKIKMKMTSKKRKKEDDLKKNEDNLKIK
jgi:hypothetical protein